MREQIIKTIYDKKLIAILRNVPSDRLIQTVAALVRGGVRLVEVTFDATQKTTNEQTAEAIATVKNAFPDLFVGAGTVLSCEQVNVAKAAGAQFILSPDFFPEVVRYTRECGLVSIPAALTPSEITAAYREGADFVKLFPAGLFGVPYVKAVRAPISHVPLLGVGNIDISEVPDYLNAGIVGFGVGGNLVDKNAIANNNFEAVEMAAKTYVAAIASGGRK